MAKRVKTRAIKVNRQYTYEKAADAVGVSCATVRRWKVDEGLEVLVSQKPHLIVGAVLKEFLDKKNAISGPKMRPGHFLCMTCGGHRGAYGKMADYCGRGVTKWGCSRPSVRPVRGHATSWQVRPAWRDWPES